MSILLAFAPFLAFAVLDRALGPSQGLLAGAAVSAVLLIRDWTTPGRSPKVLECGTAVLFGGLAMVALIYKPAWSIVGVRLWVDAGVLLIVLASIAIRRPFTLQYAREQVAPEAWASPTFLHINDVLTAAWALAFAVMVAADLILVYLPGWSPRLGIIMTVLALVGAVKFTAWYPEYKAGR